MSRNNVGTTYLKIFKLGGFMIFQKSRTLFWRLIIGIYDFGVVQPGSAVGSEVRGLGRALRWLIPSNQPTGQLHTQWRCQEKSETASSRSKRLWNFEVFDCTLVGDFL